MYGEWEWDKCGSVEGTQHPGKIHLKRIKFKESNKEGAIFITVN